MSMTDKHDDARFVLTDLCEDFHAFKVVARG
jgi:hypothetical protein